MHQAEGEPNVIKFSLSIRGGRQWPFVVVIRYGHLIFECAGSLHHRAVSGDLDVPLFWSCNQRNIFFRPVEASIFRNQSFSTIAGRYYALRTIQSFIQPDNVFMYLITLYHVSITLQSSDLSIIMSAFSPIKISWIWSSFPIQNGGQWGCGVDLSTICAYRSARRAAGSLDLDSVKTVAA